MTSKLISGLNALALLFVAFIKPGNTLSEPLKNAVKKVLDFPRGSFLNFTDHTKLHGYRSTRHSVTTEDGYILTMFNMKRRVKCLLKKKGPPVILMHGLLQSADAWIDAGPKAGLAYLVTEECYDVWLGNCRGNYYSKGRTNPTSDYWNFSVDEIGQYDVPAMIEFVLNETRADKVNYIGFSQGAGTFFIMCSERPGFCDKVNVMIGLAPAARQTYTRSPLYRYFTTAIYRLEDVLKVAGVNEVLPQGGLIQELLAFFCPLDSMSVQVCGVLLGLIDGFHPASRTEETTKVLFGHFPSGTSVHNMARYGQSMWRQDFTKFDYGKQKNMELYNSEDAPKYNLSAVTVPVVVLYGKNDGLVAVKDVKWLTERLPNVIEEMEVGDPLWTHLDMTYSQFISTRIFPKVKEYLEKYS